MDVRRLLNDEDSLPRPNIYRFGAFDETRSDVHHDCKAERLPLLDTRTKGTLHHHQPRTSTTRHHNLCQQHLPPPPVALSQSRTPSYSSTSSSSSAYTSTSTTTPSSSSCSPYSALPPHHRSYLSSDHCSESLPALSTRLPTLVRSDSADSDRAHSPTTPDANPTATLSFTHQQQDSLRTPAHKAVSYFERTLPGLQTLSHASSPSGAPSAGPPSSMDPFATTTTTGTGFLNDMAFSPIPIQPYYTPQIPIATSPEQHPNAYSSNRVSPQKTSQKKNSYPCPLSRQFNCSEFFTTSGHAARHAKKHTGKKDAICPECNKAFTRKDNMEQHRRTHSKDSSASARSTSTKPQPDKDESRQRKLLKMQQSSKKQRPLPLSTPSLPPSTGPLSSTQLTTMTSPSIPSTITSPIAEMSTPLTSHSAPTPLPMDMALDPRLRDGSVSSASGPISGFSPPNFVPSPFSVSNTPNTTFPSHFSPDFASALPQPQQFQIPQQSPPQSHHRHSSLNMNAVPPILNPMDSMMSHPPQRASLHLAPFSNSLDFMSPAQLGSLGLGMSIPPPSGQDMGMHGGMGMLMNGNDIPMSMGNAVTIMDPTHILQNVGLSSLSVTPAMDKLALDRLALAAEAASNGP